MMFINNANALTQTTWIFTSKMDAGEFILLAISLFVLAAWIFSIIFILWWGLLLILSWGKDNKIEPAVNTIRYAIIWIVVTVATIFVFPILGWVLWLDVEKYAKPEKIFQKIEEIWNKVFWKSSTSSTTTSDPQSLDDFPNDF